MKGQEETRKWGNQQFMHFVDPASVSNSWQWQGNNEAGGSQWDKLSLSDGKGSEEFGNIIHWDDSAARDAFFSAKERHEAALKGLPYSATLLTPDLYIQHIDWDKHEVYDIPDSADALSTKKEKGLNKRRGYNRVKGSSRDVGSSLLKATMESHGWKKIKSDNDPGNDLQPTLLDSGHEVPMTSTISWTNAVPVADGHPVLPEWNLGHQMSIQAQWQGQSTNLGWQWQAQPTQKGPLEATYYPSVFQPVTPSGRLHHSQAHLQGQPTRQWHAQPTQNGSRQAIYHQSIIEPTPSRRAFHSEAHLQCQSTNSGWQWPRPTQKDSGEAAYHPSVHQPKASSGWVHHSQAHLQGQSMDSGWRWQTQPSQNVSGEPLYHPSVIQPIPLSGWTYHSQTPVGVTSACATVNRKPNPSFPGQWDTRFPEQGSSSKWDSHNLSTAQPVQHQVRFGDAPRPYVGTTRANKGWER